LYNISSLLYSTVFQNTGAFILCIEELRSTGIENVANLFFRGLC